MLNITMAKKGIGTVVFSQRNSGEMVDITTIGGATFTVMPNDANGIYKEYIANGFTVKVTPEKVASPKKPKVEKPKVSREEALTKAYGTKEERKAYIEAKKAFRRFYLNKGMKYGKEFDSTVKNALRKWEEAGRPAYNC